MLTQELKKKLQSDLFRHLDGIVTAPSLHALGTKGVLDYLLEHKQASLEEIVEKFEANDGYLNVALRVLASQGWLTQHINNETDEISYSTTDSSQYAFSHAFLYDDVVHLLKFSEKYHHRIFEIEPFRVLEKIFSSTRFIFSKFARLFSS